MSYKLYRGNELIYEKSSSGLQLYTPHEWVTPFVFGIIVGVLLLTMLLVINDQG